jgi:hypothetical protein
MRTRIAAGRGAVLQPALGADGGAALPDALD